MAGCRHRLRAGGAEAAGEAWKDQMAARAGCQAARQRRVLPRGCMRPRALRCEPQPGRALTFDAHPGTWRVGRKRKGTDSTGSESNQEHTGRRGEPELQTLALCRNTLAMPRSQQQPFEQVPDAPGGTSNHF